MNDLSLLVLAHRYDFFIKEQINAVTGYINNIDLIIHHNYFSEVSNYLPSKGYLSHIKKFTRENVVNSTDKPQNVNIHILPMLYFLPDGKNVRLANKIANKTERIIKKSNMETNLVHAHFILPQGYAAVKLGQKFDIPVIITAHGHDVYDMPFRDKKWRKRIIWILNQADHIITVSNRNKGIMVKRLGIDKEKISIIPNGFDGNKFYPKEKKEVREELGLPKNKKIILNVANLVNVKGQKYLIESIEEISKRRKDILCIIIGSGELKRELENKIKKSNLGDYIKLAGARHHDEIPLWMNAADVFVLPSLNEGNPTAMFEALGVGLPFVGTKVGGIPEIITSEDYGLLVEPANPEDLAEKILIALDKKWNREKILNYAEQFTWANIAKETLKIYEKVLR